MAVGSASGFQPHQAGFDHFGTEQHNQPVYRPDEFFAAAAPAHALGNGQGAQGFLYDGRQQRAGGLSRLDAAVQQPGALVGFQAIQLIHLNPAGTGKAFRRLGGLAIAIKSCLQRRSAAFYGLVRLGGGQFGDDHCQAARAGQGANLGKW